MSVGCSSSFLLNGSNLRGFVPDFSSMCGNGFNIFLSDFEVTGVEDIEEEEDEKEDEKEEVKLGEVEGESASFTDMLASLGFGSKSIFSIIGNGSDGFVGGCNFSVLSRIRGSSGVCAAVLGLLVIPTDDMFTVDDVGLDNLCSFGRSFCSGRWLAALQVKDESKVSPR